MFTCDKLRVQNVLKNALEKLSEGLKLQNFLGGACPQTPPSFRALCARKASLHLLTFSPPAQKHLPTPLFCAGICCSILRESMVIPKKCFCEWVFYFFPLIWIIQTLCFRLAQSGGCTHTPHNWVFPGTGSHLENVGCT